MSKREYLNKLIENSALEEQKKINKIINTLLLTEDQLKAKPLSKKILNGDLDNIGDKVIDNLIDAFTVTEQKINPIKEQKTGDIKEVSKDKNGTDEYESVEKQEIETLRLEVKKIKQKMNQVLNENEKLKELIKLTNMQKPIRVNENDINELYLRYKADGTKEFGKAFIINDIIPSEYYKL